MLFRSDLHAEDLSRDVETLVNLVRNIANLTLEDGLAFDGSSASGVVIRDEDEYSGVRVSLTAKLASANVALHVDVNVGDPISPAPQEISLPRLLGAPVALRGYPMEMVHAEKIVTAVSRGTANTRWRDFGDVYSLSGLHAIEGDDLLKSLSAVASHRQVDLIPLSVTLEGYAAIAQTRYTTWRRKQQRDDLPEEFQIVLERVFAFSYPALAGSVSGMAWNPFTLSWD